MRRAQERQQLVLTGWIGRVAHGRMLSRGGRHLRQLLVFDPERGQPDVPAAGGQWRKLCGGGLGIAARVAEGAGQLAHRARGAAGHQAGGVRQHHRVGLGVGRAGGAHDALTQRVVDGDPG